MLFIAAADFIARNMEPLFLLQALERMPMVAEESKPTKRLYQELAYTYSRNEKTILISFVQQPSFCSG
jgi:hypothetical protein